MADQLINAHVHVSSVVHQQVQMWTVMFTKHKNSDVHQFISAKAKCGLQISAHVTSVAHVSNVVHDLISAYEQSGSQINAQVHVNSVVRLLVHVNNVVNRLVHILTVAFTY